APRFPAAASSCRTPPFHPPSLARCYMLPRCMAVAIRQQLTEICGGPSPVRLAGSRWIAIAADPHLDAITRNIRISERAIALHETGIRQGLDQHGDRSQHARRHDLSGIDHQGEAERHPVVVSGFGDSGLWKVP